MRIALLGLGKMGHNMAERLLERGYDIFGFDLSPEARASAEELGAKVFSSLTDLLGSLPAPRVIWIMVPHSAVDKVLAEVLPHLEKGDTVIDGGNSLYKDSIRRAKELAKTGINFLDVGMSGGPNGAREGSCLMIGGKREDFLRLKTLFEDLTETKISKYAYVGPHGAGHFVKMVHNMVEYGMMQAIAEGFTLLKEAKEAGTFSGLELPAIADLYNHGSVIESRLMGWMSEGFDEFGEEMKDVSSKVGRSGEGDWAMDIAKELGAPAPVLEAALNVRICSAKCSGTDCADCPEYTGKLLQAMRNRFGGHDIKNL